MAGRELDPVLTLLQQLVTQVKRGAFAIEIDLRASLPAFQVSELRTCGSCGCQLVMPDHAACPVCSTALEEGGDV